MNLDTSAKADVSPELLDAIRELPTIRLVQHCGTTFESSPLSLYATCPKCGTQIKLRAYSAAPEIEDLFDAVIEWMSQPGAEKAISERAKEIAADEDE